MRGFVVDLSRVVSFSDFVAAFNEGFCRHCAGHWDGNNWDAFHDLLSWPPDDYYRLVFHDWEGCHTLGGEDRKMICEVLAADHPHVQAVSE